MRRIRVPVTNGKSDYAESRRTSENERERARTSENERERARRETKQIIQKIGAHATQTHNCIIRVTYNTIRHYEQSSNARCWMLFGTL